MAAWAVVAAAALVEELVASVEAVSVVAAGVDVEVDSVDAMDVAVGAAACVATLMLR